MIYSFSDEEWTLLENRLQTIRPFMPGLRFSGIQTAIRSMQQDHTIHTTHQLNMVILLLQMEISKDREVGTETEKALVHLPTVTDESGDALLRLSVLYDTLRYYRNNRRYDAGRMHERER